MPTENEERRTTDPAERIKGRLREAIDYLDGVAQKPGGYGAGKRRNGIEWALGVVEHELDSATDQPLSDTET